MKTSDLHTFWTSPDNSRVTSKQYSFRLPVHVAAKISALVEMYPQKTRTEIVGDLLSTALNDFINSLPVHQGKSLGYIEEVGEEVFEESGPKIKFLAVADKYYKEIEREMGNENPTSLQKALQKFKEVGAE